MGVTVDNAQYDNTWYIHITRRVDGKYSSFVAAGGKSYHSFKELASRRGGMDIVAENFDVTDDCIDRVMDLKVRRLVKALNKGRKVDIQRALDQACHLS